MRSIPLRALEAAIHDLVEGRLSAYHVVGTGAFWACALDEQLRRVHGTDYDIAREADPDGSIMHGLRLARNAITHGAVVLNESTGFTFPVVFPTTFGHEVYRTLDEVLRDFGAARDNRSVNRKQDRTYADRVAGRRIVEPLQDAQRWFTRVEQANWDIPI